MGNFPRLAEGTKLPVGSHQVTVLKYLSEGGFAHIYKVRIDPEEEGDDIACLKRVIVPDKNGLNQLRKEVDVMKILRHARSIVRYYDSHAERLPDGTYQVLVLMELCPNRSLLDYMNDRIKTKLSEPEILKILFDISLGIYEMHKIKLIHRDIKIENVLINVHNDFKLCDFGSTSSPLMPPQNQQEFQALSHDILYQTTPQYRSPEMIDLYRGFPIDEKSDIWALGCFLYKLCYYTTPFEANGDIAILHASFQFLPSPSFSGDLKNLIIIMLQESPLFRPNIVQVIMLVSTMLKLDFNDLDIEDFYNTGNYNFHALHEYQRHKQNELLKQQQLYFQQQQQQQQQLQAQQEKLAHGSPVPESRIGSSTNLSTKLSHEDRSANKSPPNLPATHPHPANSPYPVVQQQPPVTPSQQHQHLQYQPYPQHQDIQTAPQVLPQGQVQGLPQAAVYPPPQNIPQIQPQTPAAAHSQQPQPFVEGMSEKQVPDEKPPRAERDDKSNDNDDDSDDLGELEHLDDVEERYPSLEDLLDDTGKPKDQTTSSSKSFDSLKSPPASQVLTKPINTPSYPIKPVILPSPEIKKLNHEELQQYNYQHQVYQSQHQYYQHQPQPQQAHYQQHGSTGKSPSSSMKRTTSIEGSKVPTAFESKEAWETSHSKIDKSAEKLADDIFAGGTKSPAPSNTQTQKTGSSAKSKASVASVQDDFSSDSDDSVSISPPSGVLTTEKTTSKPLGEDAKQGTNVDAPASEATEEVKDDVFEEYPSENTSPLASNSEANITTPRPRPEPHSASSQYTSAPSVPTLGSSSYLNSQQTNPFPYPPKKQPPATLTAHSSTSRIPQQNAPVPQAQAQHAQPLQQHFQPSSLPQSSKEPKLPERKNANPWGKFTSATSSNAMSKVSSHPGTMNVAPSISDQDALHHGSSSAVNISEQFGNMSLYNNAYPNNLDSTRPPANEHEEPNLIDLEVGLDSTSSGSATPSLTPMVLPKSKDGNVTKLQNEPSLLDLQDLDESSSKPPDVKPAFKKRLSSMQKPANFSFQEEVIDFASDDENPENNSKMNRISIRNSLKKPKGRKSAEHKRSESGNLETNKKRLSFFGGNSSGNNNAQ